MKKLVLELDLTTGEIKIDAVGFQGRSCEGVVKLLEDGIEEKNVVLKTENQVKQEVNIEIIL